MKKDCISDLRSYFAGWLNNVGGEGCCRYCSCRDKEGVKFIGYYKRVGDYAVIDVKLKFLAHGLFGGVSINNIPAGFRFVFLRRLCDGHCGRILPCVCPADVIF
jgi:hypothetical protein